jgi:hypothetical protein
VDSSSALAVGTNRGGLNERHERAELRADFLERLLGGCYDTAHFKGRDPMFTSLPRKVYALLRSALRLFVIAAIMMGVGRVLEEKLSAPTFKHLTDLQLEALAAVDSLDPYQIKGRFLCALTPSVESMNRHSRYHLPASTDCMYSLSLRPPSSSEGVPVDRAADAEMSLPPPVVGHWAEGSAGLVMPFLALLDTGWHLVVQPSAFAAFFAISTLVIGGLATGLLMAWAASKWGTPGPLGLMLFCVGTIAAACAAAWGLRMLMEGGLYVFSQVTQLAGLCCGGAGMTLFGYTLATKAVEVRIHEGVDHLIPH